MSTPTPSHEVRVKIRWADVDAYGHLRHSAFADWATFARSEWFEGVGLTPAVFAKEGTAPITLEETSTFLKEVRLGETLTLRMQRAAASADGSRFVHEVTFERNEVPVARYRMTGAWLNLQARRIVAPPALISEAVELLEKTASFRQLD
ncbi:acyl-CoA thioesterase [Aquincola tertiaricarbonis]|uniref:Acyl-CoA thioesterase n=1 Tax=Aquincola tertiaricarbonis TaxID=391953 RepID=A0ABY4S0R1_AQUTE|nr:thioesterase family protein [Aquincola tertiaricarbonis]URI06100.1 acyl-CoA thioesterase [Aquincola tertiaricarbonis]